jgi:hypothetical protein
MKKIFLVLIGQLFLIFPVCGQQFVFKTGINHTSYAYNSSVGGQLLSFIPGRGVSNSLGLETDVDSIFFIKNSRSFLQSTHLKNELALTLDGFNSFAENRTNSYQWQTTYGGIRNTLTLQAPVGKLDLGVSGAIGFSSLVWGISEIDGLITSLRKQKDFTGIFFGTGLGFSGKYTLMSPLSISLTYMNSTHWRVANPGEEKFRFINQSLVFGIHIKMD